MNFVLNSKLKFQLLFVENDDLKIGMEQVYVLAPIKQE